MSYTAHNIRFDDGYQTIPGAPEILADEAKCLGVKRLLSLIYGGDVKGKRIADLACLEGGYALEFARMGMNALGIEVRPSNIANCNAIQQRAMLPNLEFVQDDVWNIKKYGQFDVVFCCGILYHLDRPHEFLRLIGEAARDAIIINTHYSPWEGNSVFALSDLERNEGLIGRWYNEHDLDDPAALNALKWSSWSNRRSFWPVKESLLQAIREAGFDLIFEQFDTVTNDDLFATLTSDVHKTFHRTMLVGIRSPAR